MTAEKVGEDERPAVRARFSTALGGGRFDGYQATVRREIALVRLTRVR